MSPLVFSLVPRSQAWCGVAKYTFVSKCVFQFPVVMKLRPIVRRDGLDPLAFIPQQFDRPVQRQFLGGPLDRSDPYQPGFPFHHRHHTRLAPAMHRVDLPIADPATAHHHRRPLFYKLFPGQPSPAVIAAIPFAPSLPGPAQVSPQGPATPFIRPNPAVNGLVTHHGLSLKLAPPDDLFGTKPLRINVSMGPNSAGPYRQFRRDRRCRPLAFSTEWLAR